MRLPHVPTLACGRGYVSICCWPWAWGSRAVGLERSAGGMAAPPTCPLRGEHSSGRGHSRGQVGAPSCLWRAEGVGAGRHGHQGCPAGRTRCSLGRVWAWQGASLGGRRGLLVPPSPSTRPGVLRGQVGRRVGLGILLGGGQHGGSGGHPRPAHVTVTGRWAEGGTQAQTDGRTHTLGPPAQWDTGRLTRGAARPGGGVTWRPPRSPPPGPTTSRAGCGGPAA